MRRIDADALRKAMYHEAMEKDSDEQKWDSGCWIRYKMFERVLEAQPTIEPERKKGKWKPDRDNEHDWYCSECDHIGNRWFSFCPNCGADMRQIGGDAE